MECQTTIKNLKINKNKSIGTVVVVVEGEEDEFRLLKHIFTGILDYNYFSLKRNKTIKHEFRSKTNKNSTVVVANTKSSSIKSVLDDIEYKDKLYTLLKEEFNRNIKNTPIYILWDRDKDGKDEQVSEYYKKAIDKFYSALDNDYDINGLLLLSYPCHESYNLSHFNKNLWKKTYGASAECKKEFNSSINSIKKMNEKTLILALSNMHNSLLEYNIKNYDPVDLKRINKIVYRKQEECFKNNKYFNALSLISIMLVDLGIIEEIN